jgi:hypothetical protein
LLRAPTATGIDSNQAPAGAGSSARGTAIGIGLCLLGASGVSWLRFALTGRLEVHGASLSLPASIGLDLLFLGLAGLAGWFYLRALLNHPERAGPRQLLASGVIIALLAATALPLTSTDAFANLAYGRLARLGFNPFVSPPQALGQGDPYVEAVFPRWRPVVMRYGPVIVLVDEVAGRAQGVIASLAVFKLEILALALGILAIAFAICARPENGASRSALVFFALNPLFAWEISGQAHNDAIMLLPFLAFVWAARAQREWIAVLCLAVALYAKFAVAPVLGLYLIFILWRSPWRAAAMGVFVLVLGAVLIAPYWAGLSTLAAPLAEFRNDSHHHARSLTSLLCWLAAWFGPAAESATYGAARIASQLLFLAAAVRAALRVRSLEDVFHESLVFLLVVDLLLAPWLESWYVTWLLPLALVDRDPRWRQVVAVYSVLSLVQYGVRIDPVSYIPVNAVPLWMIYRLRYKTRADAESPSGEQGTPSTVGLSI